MQERQICSVTMKCLVILSQLLGSEAQVLSEQFICNNLLSDNVGTEPSISLVYYGISSQFCCAHLCLRGPSCVTHRYYIESNSCAVYDRSFVPSWLANQQICQRKRYALIFSTTAITTTLMAATITTLTIPATPTTTNTTTLTTPTTALTTPTTTPTTATTKTTTPMTTTLMTSTGMLVSSSSRTTILTTFSSVVTPSSACASSLTAFLNLAGSLAPCLKNCTCDKALNAVDLSSPFIIDPISCHSTCHTNTNCLAFSYFMFKCRIATTSSQRTLIYSPDSFACYC